MNSQLMTSAQQSTPSSNALWGLDGGEALRLDIGPGARQLQVTEGRLWLTREGTPESPSEDIWLAAGESVTLASGGEWVAEGWGATHFQLLVPPQACPTMQRRLSERASSPRRVSPSSLAGSAA
jgi:hypothetical protein